MLIFVPSLLLFVSATAISVLRRLRPGYGYSWLISVVGSFLAWLGMLVFHWQSFIPLTFQFTPVSGVTNPVTFQLDLISWPYAFSLAALGLAVMLTNAARLGENTTPTDWAASLAVVGTGLLAVMSGTPLGLILTWSILDIVDLVFVVGQKRSGNYTRSAVLAFILRVCGTMMMLIAMIYSQSKGKALTFTDSVSGVGLLMLISAGLRLGIIPLHLVFTQESGARRGQETALTLVSIAASLVFLGRMPLQAVPANWVNVLLPLMGLAAVYAGGTWLASENEIAGRPYWLAALSAVAVGCALHGQPASTLAWGVATILVGGMLFLFSAREKWLWVFLILAAVSFTGAPFTPVASGWDGLLKGGGVVSKVLFFIACFFLLLGYLRHTFRPGAGLSEFEGWIRVVYAAGLGILLASFWLVGVTGYPGSFTLGTWWAGGLLLFLSILAAVWIYFKPPFMARWQGRVVDSLLPTARRISVLRWIRRIGGWLSTFLQMDWLYRLVELIYGLFQQVIKAISALLEGSGGVLWAILLLAMVFALLLGQGGV